VENPAVSKGETLSFGKLKAAGTLGGLREIVKPKRIGGKEAVVAGVPAGRMAEILRMVETGNADGLAIEGAGEIDPA